MFKNTSELFEFNKMIFIYILVTLIAGLWILRMIQAERFLFKKTPIDLFIGVFFLSQIVSTIFSIDRHTSIFGYYGRFNGGMLSLITYIVLFYSLVEFLHHDMSRAVSFIRKFLNITLLSSFLVILWGLPGRIGHDLSCLVFTGVFDNACWTAQFDPAARMFSTLGQPNWLGAYLSIVFFFILYLFFTSSNNWNQDNKSLILRIGSHPIFYYVLLFINLIAIYFTNSRSTNLSIAVSSALFLVWFLLNRKKVSLPHARKKVLVFIFGLLICVMIFKTGIASIDKYLLLDTYKQVLNKENNSQVQMAGKTADAVQNPPLKITESFDIRQIVWKGAVQLGMDYPLFGTGVETFAYSYYFVRPAEHNLTSEWDYLYNKAHNEYLNYFATTGFLGLGSYLMLLAAISILSLYGSMRSFKSKPDSDGLFASFLQLCLFASWVTILVTNFFGFSTTTINLYFFSLPAIIYILQLQKDKKNASEISYKANTKSPSNVVGFGITFLVTLYLIQYFASYWYADIKYALAENHAKINQDYQSAVVHLTRAMELHPEHVYEDKLSFYLANLAFLASYQKDTRLVQEYSNASDSYNTSSLNQSPQNILYLKTRIKNLYIYYQITLDKKYLVQGIEVLHQARKLSPTDPKLPYFLSTYYSLLYDEEKDAKKKSEYQVSSLDAIDTSIHLKNDYYESYYLKAQLLKKYGKNKEARETLSYILKTLSPNNAEIMKELETLK